MSAPAGLNHRLTVPARQSSSSCKLCGGDPAAAEEWWHFAPSDLGFYSEWGAPGRPKVDVSNLPVPSGEAKCFTPIETHADIDMLADVGIMYRGERERLHTALDGNLRCKEAIDRLGDAAGEAFELEQLARRALVDVKPTTPDGAAALLAYMGEMIG